MRSTARPSSSTEPRSCSTNFPSATSSKSKATTLPSVRRRPQNARSGLGGAAPAAFLTFEARSTGCGSAMAGRSATSNVRAQLRGPRSPGPVPESSGVSEASSELAAPGSRRLRPALERARASASFDLLRTPARTVLRPRPSPSSDYLEQLGFPGEYPFTRGVQPTMYRGRLWTMRQYAGFASAEEIQPRYRYLLTPGTDRAVGGVRSADPDRLRRRRPAGAEGEVGRVGVSISCLDDMATLVRRHPARPGLHQHDDQRAGGDPAGDVPGRRPPAGSRSCPPARARSRTTSSRSTSPAGRTSFRPRRPCAW